MKRISLGLVLALSMVASAIPALQESGGPAAAYCPPGDAMRWVATVLELLRQKQCDPRGWELRRRACLAAASRFDWGAYAREMAQIYTRTAQPAIAHLQAS